MEEEQAYTIQEVEVQPTTAAPATMGGVITAVALGFFSMVASIATAYLQVRGAKQNKETADQHCEQLDTNKEIITKAIKDNTETLAHLDENLTANNKVTVATARAALKSIYDRLVPNKVLTITEKSMIEEMYSAYKAVTYPDGHHPNSWADAIVQDMRSWKVVPDSERQKVIQQANKKK